MGIVADSWAYTDCRGNNVHSACANPHICICVACAVFMLVRDTDI